MAIGNGDLSLGQLVRQIAAALKQDDVTLPLKNQRPWHMLFYDLSRMPTGDEKPPFLDNLVFDWDSAYPQCQELSEFLHALHTTASASASNPSFETINIGAEQIERWTSQRSEFEPGLRSFVDRATEVAKRRFAA